MSLAEILVELSQLSEQERYVLRDHLENLQSEEWQDDGLTDDDKKMILDRIENARRDPSSLVSWESAKARMQAKTGSW